MLAEKVLRIIRSCRTFDQLLTAERYFKLAKPRIADRQFAGKAETALRIRFYGIRREMAVENMDSDVLRETTGPAYLGNGLAWLPAKLVNDDIRLVDSLLRCYRPLGAGEE